MVLVRREDLLDQRGFSDPSPTGNLQEKPATSAEDATKLVALNAATVEAPWGGRHGEMFSKIKKSILADISGQVVVNKHFIPNSIV
jgi:hypothetical protein